MVGPAVLAVITLPALVATHATIALTEILPALLAAAATVLVWRRSGRLPVTLFGGPGVWGLWGVAATSVI